MAPARKKLHTLTEASELTGISMPTLQRYKKNYQKRIPSVGKGRKQRYPKEALTVLLAIKEENLKKRGRPAGGGKPRKKKKGASSTGGRDEGLLTLLEIRRRTGISYPTLLRYVKLYSKQIPHVGSGRKRRYPPSAVAVFTRIRGQSQRGPKGPISGGRSGDVASAALAGRIKKLEKANREVNKQLNAITRLLKKPLQITIKPS